MKKAWEDHSRVKCNCGHYPRDHYLRQGYCDLCGCTWYWPNDKYIKKKLAKEKKMFEDLMNQDNLTREQLVMIYVINTMNELVDMGLLEGGAFDVTEKGLKLIENLDPEPTEEEIIKAIDALKLEGYIG